MVLQRHLAFVLASNFELVFSLTVVRLVLFTRSLRSKVIKGIEGIRKFSVETRV